MIQWNAAPAAAALALFALAIGVAACGANRDVHSNGGSTSGEGASGPDVVPVEPAALPDPVPPSDPVVDTSRGPAAESARDGSTAATGRAFLVSGKREEKEYGRFTYVLFAGVSAPDSKRYRQYAAAIAAWYEKIQTVEAVRTSFKPARINVTYMPVVREQDAARLDAMSESHRVKAILVAYDYPRARKMLNALKGDYAEGLYIISTARPLTETAEKRLPVGRYYHNDLSGVEPKVVKAWMAQFLVEARKKEWWVHEDKFVDKARNILEKATLPVKLGAGYLAGIIGIRSGD